MFSHLQIKKLRLREIKYIAHVTSPVIIVGLGTVLGLCMLHKHHITELSPSLSELIFKPTTS